MAYPNDKPTGMYSLRDKNFAEKDDKKISMDEVKFLNGYKNADESDQESVPDAHEQNWLFDVLYRNLRYTLGVAEENKNLLATKKATVNTLGQIIAGKGLNISNEGVLSVVNGIADKANIISYDLPVGSYMLWAGTEETVPEFFIEPKGQTLLRDNYPDLWQFIDNNKDMLLGDGKLFGEGDGKTNFTVTDLRDTFISIASQNNVGTFTPDGLPNIEGNLSTVGAPQNTEVTGCFERLDITSGGMNTDGNDQPIVKFNASKSSKIYGNSNKVTPANWSLRLILKAMKTPATHQVPIGTILDYTGSIDSIPDGYIVADGSEIPKEQYIDLYNWAKRQGLFKNYAQLPSTPHGYYAENNDSTKFRIPDLRGVFKRNIEHNTNRGGESVVGAYQNDGLPNIEGSVNTHAQSVGASGAFGSKYFGSGSRAKHEYTHNYYGFTFNASKSNSVYGRTTNSVQPKNVTTIPILKY